ncbi:ISL3 family transposase [Candidatus Poriferisocius sp.]|uniref:ISL3 family transposase n=1 Tax=Candidatus Poriferisocius sp. TaxID=3101276 RepID=UPI003B01AC20
MVQDSSAVEFGALGLEVTGVEEVGGEVVVRVQSPGGQAVFCDGCGRRARSKGRREVVLRDAPFSGGRPQQVVWNKRVWVCPDAHCAKGSWTERSELAGPRRVLTERAARWAVGRLAAVEGSVASLARQLGVAWHTMWSHIASAAEQAAASSRRVGPVAKLGFDETVMASASRRRRRRFITAAVDADTGRVVDVFEGRDSADLRKWVSKQAREWVRAVEVVCIDPHEGYRSAIRSLRGDRLRAGTQIAVDPFHVVRLANQAVDRCRRRTQNDTTGHRGRKGDPLYGARKLLLTGQERLDATGWDRLRAALDAGDPYDEVADCWEAKEKVRAVFKTAGPDQAAARLDDAISWCQAPEAAPELHRLARTLKSWQTEIHTSIATRAHNGRTEAANAKIKDIKRSARGFRNFTNYRLRILLAAGQKPRETQPVTKIRTRRPSFNA